MINPMVSVEKSSMPQPSQPEQRKSVDEGADHGRWAETLRNEIDSYFEMMKKFNSKPPFEVLQDLSSIVSRVAEIRVILSRSNNMTAQAIRTKEVDPLLDAAEKLFRIHSRLIALQEKEYDTNRGQF
jgi:hypothetical protein